MLEAGPAIRLLQMPLKNIHGENGIFFLNAKGRLCATQRVTLTNVSEILQATNAVLREYAKDQLAVFEKGRDDPALVRAIRRALLERMDFSPSRVSNCSCARLCPPKCLPNGKKKPMPSKELIFCKSWASASSTRATY